jgi:hypothetical protein
MLWNQRNQINESAILGKENGSKWGKSAVASIVVMGAVE